MASVNKVQLIGNLGQDPEIKDMGEGRMVAKLSVATSRSWTDKAGERHESTEWTRVEVFGKAADVAGKYLVKGRQVYIEGYLKTDKWTDSDGVERYTTKVVCENMQMLGQRDSSDQETYEKPQQAKKTERPTAIATPAPTTRRGSRLSQPQPAYDEEDIPL